MATCFLCHYEAGVRRPLPGTLPRASCAEETLGLGREGGGWGEPEEAESEGSCVWETLSRSEKGEPDRDRTSRVPLDRCLLGR